MEQHFPVAVPLHARVKVLSARVEVEPAQGDTATCAVEPLDPEHEPSVHLAAGARIRLRGDRLDVTVRGTGPALRDGELLVRLGLPAGSRLSVHAGRASIHVRGGLDVLDAKLGAGDVDADAVERALTVQAAQVDVTVTRAAKASVTAGRQGCLRARQVRDAEFRAAEGKVELGATDGHVVTKGAAVDLLVHEVAGGVIDFTAATGSARVAVVAGTAVQLDLLSATGTVRCELPHDDDLARGDVSLKLRLRSATGDLLVTSVAEAAAGGAGG